VTPFAGSGLLIRSTVRQDRVLLPVWIGALVATVAATIGAFAELYPDVVSRSAFAASVGSNAVFTAFYGPLFSAADNGALTAWRLGTVGSVILALMSTFVVTRHTRREEETGRAELIGSAAVGRPAPLIAALTVAVAANTAAAVLCTAVLTSAGEDAPGAAAFGLALAGGGLVFAGVAAVAAQLVETARAANSVTIAVLGTAFLVRAVGDTAEGLGWIGWLSPLGWVEQVRPFAGNRWWVVTLLWVTAGVLAATAGILNARRDLGGSLLRTRRGPQAGSRFLAGPFALGARRQRGAVVGWSVAFVVMGAVFGALAESIGGLVGSSPQIGEVLRQLGGPGVLLDGYFSGVFGIVALFAAGFAVSAMLRLRTDETALLVEPVLATGISRRRLLATHAVWVFAVPALLMLLAGAAAGIAADLTLDDGTDHVGRLVAASAVQVPAIWVIGGVATSLFGICPRWSTVAWVALGGCALLAEIGPVIGLPQVVLDVSPFTAVPHLVGDSPVSATPLVALTLVSALLVSAGWVGFGRRDIG
jgi:ABC-2 type transport system permease protein